MKPAILYQIGKKGISENTIKDISEHLKKGRNLRIKFLRSFLTSSSKYESTETIIKMINIPVEYKLIGNILQIRKK